MNFKASPKLHRHHLDKSFFYSWEMILVYIFIALNAILMIAVPDIYFANGSFQTIIRSGMDLAIMVLGMTFILVLGEIDVSAASVMLMSAMVIGLTYQAGVPAAIAVILGILTGAVCGLINGLFVALLNMPSVIVTIATSMLFRGLVRVVLKDSYLNTFPSFFVNLAWDDIGGIIPVSMIAFLALAVIFGIVLHKSKFGRELYIIGNSKDVAKYSGIKVNRTRIIAFVIMGITAALSSMVFVGRLDGITFSMGTGYELKVIAIVVLGGVSTLGGKGKIYGPVISTFIMAFLAKSLDLFEVHPNVQKIAIGVILIAAVLIPRLNKETFLKIKFRFKAREIRRLESIDVPYNIEKAKQDVIAKRGHRMGKDEFLTYLKNLSITTTPLENRTTYEQVLLAKKDYKIAKTFIRGLDRHDKELVKKVKEEIADKKLAYRNAKIQHILYFYDIPEELVRTYILLIKLNYQCVINEISDSADRHYEGYQYKSASIDDFNKYLKSITLTNWDINEKISKSEIRRLRNKYLKSMIRAARFYTKKNGAKYVTLADERDVNYLIYKFQSYQPKISKCYHKEHAMLMKALKRLHAKELEAKKNEKK